MKTTFKFAAAVLLLGATASNCGAIGASKLYRDSANTANEFQDEQVKNLRLVNEVNELFINQGKTALKTTEDIIALILQLSQDIDASLQQLETAVANADGTTTALENFASNNLTTSTQNLTRATGQLTAAVTGAGNTIDAAQDQANKLRHESLKKYAEFFNQAYRAMGAAVLSNGNVSYQSLVEIIDLLKAAVSHSATTTSITGTIAAAGITGVAYTPSTLPRPQNLYTVASAIVEGAIEFEGVFDGADNVIQTIKNKL